MFFFLMKLLINNVNHQEWEAKSICTKASNMSEAGLIALKFYTYIKWANLNFYFLFSGTAANSPAYRRYISYSNDPVSISVNNTFLSWSSHPNSLVLLEISSCPWINEIVQDLLVCYVNITKLCSHLWFPKQYYRETTKHNLSFTVVERK